MAQIINWAAIGAAIVGWATVAAMNVWHWSTFDEAVDWRNQMVDGPKFFIIEKALREHRAEIEKLKHRIRDE